MIVEGIDGNTVQLLQELRLVDSGLLNGSRNLEVLLQPLHPRKQVGNFFIFGCSAQTEVFGNLHITAPGLGPVILREGRLLHRIVIGVVADHITDKQCVRQPVRQMVSRTNLVRHRVACAKKRVGKGNPGQCCRVVHLFAGLRVLCAVLVRRGKILLQQLQRL